MFQLYAYLTYAVGNNIKLRRKFHREHQSWLQILERQHLPDLQGERFIYSKATREPLVDASLEIVLDGKSQNGPLYLYIFSGERTNNSAHSHGQKRRLSILCGMCHASHIICLRR